MGRPLTGKTHVGIRRETRSNGDVYDSKGGDRLPNE